MSPTATVGMTNNKILLLMDLVFTETLPLVNFRYMIANRSGLVKCGVQILTNRKIRRPRAPANFRRQIVSLYCRRFVVAKRGADWQSSLLFYLYNFFHLEKISSFFLLSFFFLSSFFLLSSFFFLFCGRVAVGLICGCNLSR